MQELHPGTLTIKEYEASEGVKHIDFTQKKNDADLSRKLI